MFCNIEIEKIDFTIKRPLFFKRRRYPKIISIQKDLFWWKNYKYFIVYLHDNHKVKSLQIKQEAAC